MEKDIDILKKGIESGFRKEIPSENFTEDLMKKVEESLLLKPAFKPLISKGQWIVSGVASLVLLLLTFGIELQSTGVSWLDTVAFELPELADFKMSLNLSLIILMVFGVMTFLDFLYRRKHSFRDY